MVLCKINFIGVNFDIPEAKALISNEIGMFDSALMMRMDLVYHTIIECKRHRRSNTAFILIMEFFKSKLVLIDK